MHSLSQWSFGEKLRFRLIFLFFSLIILPFPLDTILGFFNISQLTDWFNTFWIWLSSGLGKSLLGLEEIPTGITGSGDMTIDWLRYGSMLGLALLGTVIWTLADRSNKHYYKLWRVFVMVLTYYVVFYMFLYGSIKVFWLQMPKLGIDRLITTYGQSSPMGLLWTFMGASKTYSMYAGFSEVIAGLLLLFRRTRTLGGLVTAGVMFNVFMLNMAYDVPVKLFSAQLMFMGLYIAMIDWKAVLGLFLFRKSNDVTPWPPFFKSIQANLILLLIQVLFIGKVAYDRVEADLERRARSGEIRETSPLFGLYDVTEFVRNGDTLPPLLTDDIRWQRLIMERPTSSVIVHMDERFRYILSEVDTNAQTVTFHIGRDSLRKSYPFEYKKLADGLTMKGILEEDTLQMRLKTYPVENLYLTNDRFKFNWINERPWHVYDREIKSNW